ncbi:O-methyltransferase, partial [Persephonella sp.]
MLILNPDVEKYVQGLSEVEDSIILEMEEYAQSRDFPIIGRQGGRLLYLITAVKKPRLVVELGSGFGYSGYWFAKALTDGKVVLIDYQEKNIKKAQEFFQKGNLTDRAEFRVGDAVQIGQEYRNIDILFLDLEKVRYLEAVKKLEKNLSDDGLIIADNVLFQGKVISQPENKKAKLLDQFNR